MTPVSFTVQHQFGASPRALWDELVDWKGHEAWIPMTRVEVGDGEPTDIGHEFTAWSGPGKLALEDRMRVAECTWDDTTATGRCTVEKLGPVLTGTAGFTVTGSGETSSIDWFEQVEVKYLPGFLAPIAAKLGAAGFRHGMKRLDEVLRDQVPAGL